MPLYSILYVGHLEFTRGMNPTAFPTPPAGGRHVWCLFHKKRVRGDLTSAWCERHVSDIQMAQLTCHCSDLCLSKKGYVQKTIKIFRYKFKFNSSEKAKTGRKRCLLHTLSKRNNS